MWDLPGPGLEPVSPELAGGFLTIAPPGKPRVCCFKPFKFVIIYSEAIENKYTLSVALASAGDPTPLSTFLCMRPVSSASLRPLKMGLFLLLCISTPQSQPQSKPSTKMLI